MPSILRGQLAENGASDAEIDILLNERVELNAMTSDALIAMIERKLEAYGLEKVVPGRRPARRRPIAPSTAATGCGSEFAEMEGSSTRRPSQPTIPDDLERTRSRGPRRARRSAMGRRHPRSCSTMTLERVREDKQKAQKKSGDFTDADEDEGGDDNSDVYQMSP